MRSTMFVGWALALIAPAAWAQNGYPVVTHYPAAGGTTADTTRKVMPSYENYSAALTDEYAPSPNEFAVAGQLVFQSGGAQARFLNDPAGLTEGATTIQVVSNWPLGAQLFTVAFPAGWRRTDRRPIVLSPNPTTYSNNYRIFRAQEAGVLAFGAARGFIAVFANAGGIESQGVSDGVLRSVGTLLDTLATQGGDKHRVVTAGFSRGAQDAFVWAANPLGLDYTVLAAFGHALPTSAVEAVSSPYATYPWLGWLSDVITNDASLSRYDHVPPPHSFPNRILEILTGQGTMEGRSARTVMEGLRGKQLVFSVASHDPVIPYRSGVAFVRALEAANIPHQAVLVQNSGHTWSQEVAVQLTAALDAIGAGRDYTAPAGRVYAVQNDVRTHDYTQQVRITRATMPFSAVLPYRSARGQPMRVDLCGAPGTQYLVCAVLDGTAATSAIYVGGTIGPEECASHALAAPLALGNYTWSVVVNGAPIPRVKSPINDLRPALQVDPVQPGHFEAMPNQTLPVQLGLSDVSPQGGEQGVGCPPPEVGPGADAGALVGDSGFTIITDTGPRVDSGATVVDAGPADTGNRAPPESGCGCASAPAGNADGALVLMALLFMAARRRNR